MAVTPLRPTSGKDPEIKAWTSRRMLWRVHEDQFAADAFNDSGKGDARFSPLFHAVGGKPIPVMYLADTRDGALAETVLHDCPTPPANWVLDFGKLRDKGLVLSPLKLTAKPRLINLTVKGLKRLGLTRAEVIDSGDYARTRELATWLYHTFPQAQGFRWVSRQDDEASSLLLFGDRLPRLALKAAAAPEPTWTLPVEKELLDLADTLGIEEILPVM
jgi:hypothetical protein